MGEFHEGANGGSRRHGCQGFVETGMELDPIIAYDPPAELYFRCGKLSFFGLELKALFLRDGEFFAEFFEELRVCLGVPKQVIDVYEDIDMAKHRFHGGLEINSIVLGAVTNSRCCVYTERSVERLNIPQRPWRVRIASIHG